MENIEQVNIADLQLLSSDCEIKQFFKRCVDEVARDLIGMYLLNQQDGTAVGGQIIETEAYCQNDPAAHCYKKEECGKNGKPLMHSSMFRGYGHIYIYPNSKEPRPKDVHLNLVCGEKGFGSAVLIRALKPELRSDIMLDNRKADRQANSYLNDHDEYKYHLCDGPINLCWALGISHDYDGKALCQTLPLKLYKASDQDRGAVCGPRILRNPKPPAKEAKDWPRRYVLSSVLRSKFLSMPMRDERDFSREKLRELKTSGPLKNCKCFSTEARMAD